MFFDEDFNRTVHEAEREGMGRAAEGVANVVTFGATGGIERAKAEGRLGKDVNYVQAAAEGVTTTIPGVEAGVDAYSRGEHAGGVTREAVKDITGYNDFRTAADSSKPVGERLKAGAIGALKVAALAFGAKRLGSKLKGLLVEEEGVVAAAGTTRPRPPTESTSQGSETLSDELRMKEQPLAGGPYAGIVPDPKDVKAGGRFTDAQRKAIFEANRRRHGGELRSDLSGVELERGKKSQKGVTPSPREAQIDHAKAAAKAGSNRSSNAIVLSRAENRAKGDKDFGQQ